MSLFLITTEKGSKIELDTSEVEEVVVEIDGIKYRITIQEI